MFLIEYIPCNEMHLSLTTFQSRIKKQCYESKLNKKKGSDIEDTDSWWV